MNYDDEVDRALWTETKAYTNHIWAVMGGWVIVLLGCGFCWLFGG